MYLNKSGINSLLLILFLFFFRNGFAQNNSYIDRAGELFIEGEWYKAVQLLETATYKNPNDARAYYNMGNFHTAAGNFEEAIKYYLKASELYPKYTEPGTSFLGEFPKYYEAIDNLALVYLVTGDFDKAISLSEESSIPGNDNLQPLRTNYLARILKGDSTGLIVYEKYKLHLKNRDNPNNDSLVVSSFIEKKLSGTGLISYLKASICEASPSKALGYLKTAMDELPDNNLFQDLKKNYSDPEYFEKRRKNLEVHNEYLKALSLARSNELGDAEDTIDDLLEDDPDNLTYLELQSSIKFSSGNSDEAIAIFRRMLSIKPNAASTWYNLGNCYARMDSLDQAEFCFLRSLEINPEYPEANAFLGTIAWMRDLNYEKAISYYKRELEINPKNEETYFNAGKMSFQKGKYDDAINYLTRLISLNPHDLEARARLIQMYETINDKERALSFTNETLEFVIAQKKSSEVIEYFSNKKKELEGK